MSDSKKYCVACGVEAPVNSVLNHERLELTCAYCGFVLDIEQGGSKKTITADCVITADDAELTRELLKGMLLKKKLARTVVAAANGQEFVTSLTRRLSENKSIDLAILDLQMPVMDGITAARVMRALEEKFKTERIPILFFSAQKCDDALKQQLALFAPASYVNKGSDTDPERLAERIDQLVTYLLNKRQNPG